MIKWILVALAGLMIPGCVQEKVRPAVKADIISKEIPAQESWKPIITITDSGNTKAVIHSGHLVVLSQAQETILDEGLQVDFYNRMQIISTTLTSKRGKVDDRTKNLYAYENVVAKNDSGVVLQTEVLVWNNNTEKITTDKFVTITTPTEKLQGYGFESDQFLHNYVIFKIVYVTNVKSANE